MPGQVALGLDAAYQVEKLGLGQVAVAKRHEAEEKAARRRALHDELGVGVRQVVLGAQDGQLGRLARLLDHGDVVGVQGVEVHLEHGHECRVVLQEHGEATQLHEGP